MTTHNLKLAEAWWDDVAANRKPFEIRFNDRNYQPSDVVTFQKWKVKESRYAAGSTITRTIDRVYHNLPGVEPGYVALVLS